MSESEQKIDHSIQEDLQVRDDFIKLQQKLEYAKSIFTGGADDDADLAAARLALNSVINHLRDIGTPIENTGPLLSLVGALEDIATGRECQMLEPRIKEGGRPARPVAYDSLLAVASAAITLLIQDKRMLKEYAAKEVVRIFESKKYPLPKTINSELENWQALAEWRDKLLRRKKNENVLDVYSKAIKHARENCGSEAAGALLEILENYGGTA